MITFAQIPKSRSSIVSFGNTDIGPYYWVGNGKNGIDYYAGQTFKAPVSGLLKKIKLYSSVVYGNSIATLSVYAFDAITHTWKEKKAEAVKRITKALESQWVEFDLPPVEVLTDNNYGFKISCVGGGMLAIAECPWHTPNPYAEGEEWVGSSYLREGKFQKDFDFAFEGEIEALPNTHFI